MTLQRFLGGFNFRIPVTIGHLTDLNLTLDKTKKEDIFKINELPK